MLSDQRHASHALPPNLPAELAAHPRYRILRELGRGGMGVVYQARQTLMNRQVIIKVINQALLEHPDAVERFRREVEAAARLSHPNIVTAYDAEQSGELHMLVMEFVPGQSLAEFLQEKGPLPVAQACHFVRQAALGLQHAFERGMVHRDIKPHNLMVTPKGQVKVLDFGLAKMASEQRQSKGLTSSGAYMGTPDYSSPEQATDARSADIRADLYSLGCTLYCLLAGRPPFEEATAVLTILAHMTKEPTPLPELRPDVPAELWEVVVRLLAKDPACRYQSPASLAQALMPFIKRPIRPAAAAAIVNPPRIVAPTTVGGDTLPPKDVRRKSPQKRAPQPASTKTTAADPFAGLDLIPSSPAQTPKKPRPAVKRGPTPVYRPRPIVAGVAALLTLALVAMATVGVLRVKTRDGVIVLENLPPNAEVLVDGDKVSITWDREGKTATISVRPGTHKIVAVQDGMTVTGEEVAIASGDGKPISVRFDRKGVPVAYGAKAPGSASGPSAKTTDTIPPACAADALRRGDLSAAVLTNVGDGDPKRVPAELVGVLGDARFRLDRGELGYPPSYSPDGRLLAVPNGNAAFVFDTATGARVRTFWAHPGKMQGTAFSANGMLLAARTDDKVIVWGTTSGEKAFEITASPTPNGSGSTGVAFSPDNRWLAFVDGGTVVRLYDLTSNKAGPRLGGHAIKVWQVRYSRDGKILATAGDDGTIRLWNGHNGEHIHTLNHGGQYRFPGVAFSPDEKYIVTGTEERFIVWDGASYSKLYERPARAGNLAYLPDGKTILTADVDQQGEPHSAIRWDVATGEEVGRFQFHSTGGSVSVTLSPDGQTVALVSSLDRVVQFYRALDGQPLTPDPGHTRPVTSVAFSPDGKWLASGSDDRTVRTWALSNGKTLHVMTGHTDVVWSVAFNPDGTLLASGGREGRVLFWDPATGTNIPELTQGCGNLPQVHFNPNGSLVAVGSGDGAITLCLAHRGGERQTFKGVHDKLVRGIAFSPDGRQLASGGHDDHRVVITDIGSGRTSSLPKQNTAVTDVQFSPDGNSVLATYDAPQPVARVWDLKRKDYSAILVGHTDNIRNAAFRRNGNILATGSDDNTVRLWDLGNEERRKTVLGKGCALAWSPNGRYLAAGDRRSGLIYLYRLPGLHESAGEWMEARGCPPVPGLSQEAWLKRVSGLSAENRLQAVSDRLRELNPGFDGLINPTIENGLVTGLDLNADEVTDLTSLQALTDLKRLNCGGSRWWRRERSSKLADLRPLKGLRLELLGCSGTQVEDLTPLAEMPLRELSIMVTPVKNLSPLRGMPLKVLRCWCSPEISDVSALRGMRLSDLLLGECDKLQDISGLEGMPLEHLTINNTRVTRLEALRGMPLRDLRCDFQPKRDVAILESIRTLQSINDKPAADFLKGASRESPVR